MANTRARVWSFIGYPGESLPNDYAEILSDEMHLSWAESPVHDADLNGDGSEKKEHIHFIVAFEGMKSYEQIKEITDRLHCPVPQRCRNPRGLVRYFIHADNPDKHQYNESDIKVHGGFEIEDYFAKSKSQLRDVLKDVRQFCEDNGFEEFCDLADAVFRMENNDWIDCVCNRNTMFLSAYLRSKRYKRQEQERRDD